LPWKPTSEEVKNILLWRIAYFELKALKKQVEDYYSDLPSISYNE
jgi:hypothetical protein